MLDDFTRQFRPRTLAELMEELRDRIPYDAGFRARDSAPPERRKEKRPEGDGE
jgi:hypothetical protein